MPRIESVPTATAVHGNARFRAVADANHGLAPEHPGQSRSLPGGGLARGDQPPENAIASQRVMRHILAAFATSPLTVRPQRPSSHAIWTLN